MALTNRMRESGLEEDGMTLNRKEVLIQEMVQGTNKTIKAD